MDFANHSVVVLLSLLLVLPSLTDFHGSFILFRPFVFVRVTGVAGMVALRTQVRAFVVDKDRECVCVCVESVRFRPEIF